ncbi:GntR family transcriptional regulator [Flindersiella endophytica]
MANTADPAERLVDHLPYAPRRQMLGNEVYESLKALIMNHVLKPGARLNIDALTKELGTSSTPVREALARLESDGLATKLALRGYSVAPVLTGDEIAELYQLRLLIEPWAAGEAATRATEADVERLTEELATCPDAPEGEAYEAYRDFSAHDARLHDLLLEIAGNETVRRAFARTHAHLHLFRVSYGKDLGLHAAAEHEAIVEAVGRHDRRGATAAMRRHLEAARDRLVGEA